jgi:transposase
MVVAVGLLAAIGPIASQAPDVSSPLKGLNPSVHQSGNGPAAWTDHQAGSLSRPHDAGRSSVASSPWPRATASLLRTRSRATWHPCRCRRRCPQNRRHRLAPSHPGLGLRMGSARAPRKEAERSRTALRPARPAGTTWRWLRVHNLARSRREERQRGERAEAAYKRFTQGWSKRGRRVSAEDRPVHPVKAPTQSVGPGDVPVCRRHSARTRGIAESIAVDELLECLDFEVLFIR